jgi:hypothetical protein
LRRSAFIDDLIAMKQAVGRPIDLADIEHLKRLKGSWLRQNALMQDPGFVSELTPCFLLCVELWLFKLE